MVGLVVVWLALVAALGVSAGGGGSRCAALSQRQQIPGGLVAGWRVAMPIWVAQLQQAAQHRGFNLGQGWRRWRWWAGEGFGLLGLQVAGQANPLPGLILEIPRSALRAGDVPGEKVRHAALLPVRCGLVLVSAGLSTLGRAS